MSSTEKKNVSRSLQFALSLKLQKTARERTGGEYTF